jgi:eukaryotic-like serine/threonine-protein kinase
MITEVLLVEDPDGGPDCTLKRLLHIHANDPDLVEAFERESALAPLLRHPHLPRLREHGRVEDIPYLVYETVDGCSLGRLLRRREEPLPEPVALRIAADVASALAHLHGLLDGDGRPLVRAHRDVAPGNVLVSGEGRAVLIDFGLVTGAVVQVDTATDVVKGTWRYAAPEQLCGEAVGPETDIYAVGCLLYLMLTGRRPFDSAEDAEALREQKLQGPLDVPGVRPGVAKLVAACTALKLSERPRSAAELALRLDDLGPATVSELREALAAEVLAVAQSRIEELRTPPVIWAELRGEDVTDPAGEAPPSVAALDRSGEEMAAAVWIAVLALALAGAAAWTSLSYLVF